MRLSPLPIAARWKHQGARAGVEAARFEDLGVGYRLTGRTASHESSAPCSLGYEVTVDHSWKTVAVVASTVTPAGSGEVTLTRNSSNNWTVNGEPQAVLDGCVDIDFESSALTNTLPLHRLDFSVGESIDVPAAFVRADDLRVERLEQRYMLIEATSERLLFHYEAPSFGFACELHYDLAGLVVDYPGIATREA